MKIIDLTQELYDGMPVYPGDPEVEVKQVHNLEKEGWNLRTVMVSTHLATHVNVPLHMVHDGKTLDKYSLDSFIGESVLYKGLDSIRKGIGVIFDRDNIDKQISDQIIKIKPKFIGLSEEFEFDIPLEKRLLEAGIISFENLANTDKLPDEFLFYGIPLKIRGADGSPVRAFAVVE